MRTFFASGLIGLLLLLGCGVCGAGEMEGRVPRAAVDDLAVLREAAEGAKLVLLGESTHGTAEFYEWRARFSEALITGDPSIRFVAVEGDWCAVEPLHQYVTGHPGAPRSAAEALEKITRWPLWLWANQETERFAEWLREHNSQLAPDERVGLYGLDIYGFWNSADRVLAFYDEFAPGSVVEARSLLEGFLQYREDAFAYVRAMDRLEKPAVEALEKLVEKLSVRREQSPPGARKATFQAYQNARILLAAEGHYRGMAVPGPDSWNARAGAFMDTVERLLDWYGPGSRGIVWAHNTHIGDARATDMRRHRQWNLGQLARERLGRQAVFAVGLGTGEGQVMAARAWGTPPEIMEIPEPLPGSWEAFLQAQFPAPGIVLWGEETAAWMEENNMFSHTRVPHRAIGVVFHPEGYGPGNYVGSVLPERYDAFVFWPKTQSVTPLPKLGGKVEE
jgi:erythromycin esterase